MDAELDRNSQDSPAKMLRDTVSAYLDPSYEFRLWLGQLNAPGEIWSETIQELPPEISALLPDALPFDTVPSATGSIHYVLSANQMIPPTEDDVVVQSTAIPQEMGEPTDGAPIVASVTLVRAQEFIPDKSPNHTSVRDVTDTLMYGIALDTDTFSNPMYNAHRMIFRVDSNDPASLEAHNDMPVPAEAEDAELQAINQLLEQRMQAAKSPDSTSDITPEDFA